MIRKRLLALFIDYFIIALFVLMVNSLDCLPMPTYVLAMLSSLPFAYLFVKDSFTGQSIGRRVLKISLIDKQTNEVISPVKALIRNLFLLIWPIELIMLLISDERIGDIITQSHIINGNKVHKVLGSSILIFIIVWVCFFGFSWYFMRNGLTQLLFS